MSPVCGIVCKEADNFIIPNTSIKHSKFQVGGGEKPTLQGIGKKSWGGRRAADIGRYYGAGPGAMGKRIFHVRWTREEKHDKKSDIEEEGNIEKYDLD